MTDSEKLILIAENQQKVYKAGQESMVDETKIIEKTATGTGTLILDDVSEIPHDISVQLSDGNLIPFPYPSSSLDKNGIKFTTNSDGSVTIKGTSTASVNFELAKAGTINIPPNVTVSIGGGVSATGGNVIVNIRKKQADGTTTSWLDSPISPSGALKDGEVADYVSIYIASGITVDTTVYPMLNIGSTAREPITDFSDVSVKAHGSNLFDISKATCVNCVLQPDGSLKSNKVDRRYCSVSFTTLNDILVASKGKYLTYSVTKPIGDTSAINIIIHGTFLDGVTYCETQSNDGQAVLRIPDTLVSVSRVEFRFNNCAVLNDNTSVFNNFMLNFGTYALPYAAYRTVERIPSANGSVSTKNMAPFMTLVADNTTVDISATYHKSYGMQTEYDRFWDRYQNNGTRTKYEYGFSGEGWTDETFIPKYDIILGEGYSSTAMFRQSLISNIAEKLETCGVRFDTTACEYFTSIFQSATSKRIPEINFTNAKPNTASASSYAFAQSAVETIDKVIVTESLVYSNTFNNCTKLKNIVFEGRIGTSINFQHCPLTPASMKSVITHLANYAGTANEGTYTVTFTETCWTALEADSAAPDGGTWRNYAEGTLGWLT